MEKFGIFDLLDTLSALVAPEETKDAAAKSAETRPAAEDAAFSPPAYGEPQPAPAVTTTNTALASFLARHEAAKQRTDGKR